MSYVKLLGLLAVAGAALMAFAGSASATTITSPTGSPYTSTITAVSQGNVALEGPSGTVSCARSHIAGAIQGHGAGVTAKGPITSLSFTECNFPVTVEAFGSLEVHAVKTVEVEPGKFAVQACAAGAIECTGTLTFTGTKLKIHGPVGECVYTATNTDVGLITPSNDFAPESTALFDVAAHGTGKIPRTAGNFLCGSTGQWTGSYSISTPDRLYIDA